MTTYIAPTREMQFVVTEVAGLDQVMALPGYEDATAELVESVLDEAARLATEVLAPLNKPADEQGARLENHRVLTADGFASAYKKFVEGGWNGLAGHPDYGGQGLPNLLLAATVEMWNSANMSFALCPLLSAGAAEAVNAHGSEEQKRTYLPKMISGEWTGTMNLTESQAGSDLSAVRTKAVPEGDHFRIFGQKIFITYGDHDMAENVIHLVLARLPDAPEGTRGISLFLVPKRIVNPDGSLGAANDVHCVSLERKMGIHASPTCVMSFGDKDGAIGYLVGQQNHGLAHMFTMMNEARQKVGLQGLGISERAYQAARDYAKERVQGRLAGQKSGDRVAIIQHPDVRRMLMTMRAQTEAMRAFAYSLASDIDHAHRHPDGAERARRGGRVDLLIPVLKGWCTEVAVEVTSLGVQVHGGMGFIEETGACQFLRDARIAPIYEGTTGIQAADLVSRKVALDNGQAMTALIDEMRGIDERLSSADHPGVQAIRAPLRSAISALKDATDWTLQATKAQPNEALAASVNYLMLTGYVVGGWYMAKAALTAAPKTPQDGFYRAKVATARFYAEQILPKATALLATVQDGGSGAMEFDEEQF